MRWGVNIDPSSDGVGYWSIILGTFMASMDLRAFPFDMQRLNIQVCVWGGVDIKFSMMRPGGCCCTTQRFSAMSLQLLPPPWPPTPAICASICWHVFTAATLTARRECNTVCVAASLCLLLVCWCPVPPKLQI